MLECYRPEPEDLWFREKLLGDEATMSYNRRWGGTIPFPESRRSLWYDAWLVHHEDCRFYRYLRDTETGGFVGEIAFRFDPERGLWLADVIVAASCRGRGCGTQGLRLLCREAARRGVDVLYDEIAVDNPGISLFRKAGFTEVLRTDESILLKKDLRNHERGDDTKC